MAGVVLGLALGGGLAVAAIFFVVFGAAAGLLLLPLALLRLTDTGVRSTTPDRLGCGGGALAAGAVGAATLGCTVNCGFTSPAGLSSPKRLRLVSTTTVLVRPCEKLCFTRPCSTAGRFSVNVWPLRGAPDFGSLVSLLSVMLSL
jgi:hypothetical protein